MTHPFLARLDAGDRAIFTRCAIPDSASPIGIRLWCGVTHLGGATATIAAAILAVPAHGIQAKSFTAVLGLTISHLAVRLVKRRVLRPRPSTAYGARFIADPDRYSFPSGHAAAALAVALGWSVLEPALAAALLGSAMIVGYSRIALGAHFPGDVIAGQAIGAAGTLAASFVL